VVVLEEGRRWTVEGPAMYWYGWIATMLIGLDLAAGAVAARRFPGISAKEFHCSR
jgi:hypothetical protein